MIARKTIVDYIADEDYDRYNELVELAATREKEYKASHKTPRVGHKLTDAEKAVRTEKQIAKLQAKLDAMLAGNNSSEEE